MSIVLKSTFHWEKSLIGGNYTQTFESKSIFTVFYFPTRYIAANQILIN